MLEPGLQGSAAMVVTAADTAVALGSGDVEVLGTPRVVALCEAATLAAVRSALADGETTVGTRVDVEHLRPSRVGVDAVATAVLEGVEGRRLRFAVEAHDDDQLVARGTVTRAVVSRDRFGGS
jgi:predicted thioesterase